MISSKSTQELLELIQSGLKEISTNENINNIELFYTMRNIISLYCDLMPLKHNALLKSIPQQAGITLLTYEYMLPILKFINIIVVCILLIIF